MHDSLQDIYTKAGCAAVTVEAFAQIREEVGSRVEFIKRRLKQFPDARLPSSSRESLNPPFVW